VGDVVNGKIDRFTIDTLITMLVWDEPPHSRCLSNEMGKADNGFSTYTVRSSPHLRN